MTTTNRTARTQATPFGATHFATPGAGLVPLCGAPSPSWSDGDIARVTCNDCLREASAIVGAGGELEIDLDA